MTIHEVVLNDVTVEQLIRLSKDWAAEDNCYGYRPNDKNDIEGNRIFFAEDGGTAIGYLFGKVCQSKHMKSIMPDGTPYFEAEELYVVPERRSQGVGAKLFRFMEEAMKSEAEYVMLSTAAKNWKAIFHFYLDELDMTFWSARLFKKLEK